MPITTHFRTAVLTLALMCLHPGTRAAECPRDVPRLRFTDHIVSAAMAHGVTHSPRFRALVARLTSSDVILHIERLASAGPPRGITRLVVAAGGVRYLRITLDANRLDAAFVGLLGHELQHAVEVADAPWVRTPADYEALYHQIGRPGCGTPQWCFDTAAARRTGVQVYSELTGNPRGVRARRAEVQTAPVIRSSPRRHEVTVATAAIP